MASERKSDWIFRLFWRLVHTALRFPVPLACAVAWTFVTVGDMDNYNYENGQARNLIQGFLVLGFFLSLSIKLFAESRLWTARRWLPHNRGRAVARAMQIS